MNCKVEYSAIENKALIFSDSPAHEHFELTYHEPSNPHSLSNLPSLLSEHLIFCLKRPPSFHLDLIFSMHLLNAGYTPGNDVQRASSLLVPII